jgi:hypothetical protein
MTLKNNILQIERENGEFDKVEFLFRYVNLNSEQFQYIQNEISNLNISSRKLKDATFVITLPLNKNANPKKIVEINNHLNLNDCDFGICISFTSNYDHSGFRLPKFIKEFYKEVGGEFDCSIINT